MSTSVTNPSKKRFKKTALVYTLLSIFFFAFSHIYESFSFGETSTYMHYLYAVPLVGGILFRGIVNLSGRSTTLDQPYIYTSIAFLVLAVLSILFTRSVWTEENNLID